MFAALLVMPVMTVPWPTGRKEPTSGDVSREDSQRMVLYGCTICAVLFVGAVVLGRDHCVPWWNVRYLAYNLVFGPVAIGITLSILLQKMSRRRRMLAVVVLLLFSLLLGLASHDALISSYGWEPRFSGK